MGRKNALKIISAAMWFITTLWFGYMSAVILWNIDMTNWMILLHFDAYGEAIIEIPIFFLSAVWLMIKGTERVSENLYDSNIFDRFFDDQTCFDNRTCS